MKPIRYVIIAALLALFALAAANWSAFSTRTHLSFFFAEVEGPLGVILLGAIAGISLLFFAYAALLRTSMLLESRRLTRELEEQRQLAEHSEASRFTELKHLLEQGIAGLQAEVRAATAAQSERLDVLEQGFCSALETSGDTVTANLGQIDDKLERVLQRSGPRV